MAGLTLVLLLLAVSVALRIVADRLPVPYPALLVVGGLALALVPHLPRFDLPPDVLFLVFVPPLLFIGAVSFPLRDLKRELGPIVRMSVLMVLVTIPGHDSSERRWCPSCRFCSSHSSSFSSAWSYPLSRVTFPSSYIGGTIGRWLRHSDDPLPGWRSALFIGWAGLRGGDSLVIALTLTLATAGGAPFPARDRILFITFCVILVTLVLQGSTLRPVARWLGLRDDGGAEDEEAHARLTAAEAGLRALEAPMPGDKPLPEVVAYLRQRHRQRARRWAAREARQDRSGTVDGGHTHLTVAPSHDAGLLDERRAAQYRRLRTVMIDAEEAALVDLRDRGEIGDDVMRNVQRELDLEEELLANRDPVVEPASEIRMGLD